VRPSRAATAPLSAPQGVGDPRVAGTPERAAGGRTAVRVMVDLFAGPGGLDQAAHELVIHSTGIEYDPGACATRRAAGHATVQGDVRAYGPADFPDAGVLAGGPPCQGFTVAGLGEGRTILTRLQTEAKAMAARQIAFTAGLDERSTLVLEPLRWALEAADLGRPYRAIVLEQVPQVLPMWETYAELLRVEGYHVATGVLHAEEHGVPQTRRRAVLIANLDHPVALPAPTRRAYRARSGDLPAPAAMGDALPHRGEFTVISNYGTGGDPKNRGRRHSSEPSATVTGKINRNRVVNPDGTEQDRFTPGEAGAFQGFPADYPWSGRDISQQIGNAVPVGLGKAIIRAALGRAA
jgi:DNA (cytosine-5)-methyltransferase 1